MTNAPTTRKTHIIRILGTNKNGDVLPDIWADVERIDEAKSVYQSDETAFQGTVKRLKWLDDPDQDDFNPDGPPSRKMKTLKVCSPDEKDQSDPEEWIPIPVIEKMRTTFSDQGTVRKHANGDTNTSRKVKARRISHYDTSIDDEAQKAFDADPARKVFVVKGDRYEKKTDTKDEGQHLEHEVITFLKERINEETRTGQGGDQGKQTKLLNQYQIDESDPAHLDVTGSEGFNPPWRLDPFQNIVNVQLGGATEFDNGSFITSPSPIVKSLASTFSFFIYIPKDGWNTDRFKGMLGFGAQPGVAASSIFGGSAIIFQADGAGRASINVTLVSDIMSDSSDNAVAAYYATVAGAVDYVASRGNRGAGTVPLDGWHHVFITNDLRDFRVLPDPSTLSPTDSRRNRDVFFAARSEIYVDRVSVGRTNTGEADRAAVVPPGYAECSTATLFGSINPAGLRQTTADFTKAWNVRPDGPGDPVPNTAGFAGISFVGPFGVPNLTGVDNEGISPGQGNTAVRYAAVQVWADQYIAPSSSNLDKFVKLGDDGKPGMVDPKLAAEAFGKPTFFYNGPPRQFTKDATVSGELGTDIKQVKAPRKAAAT